MKDPFYKEFEDGTEFNSAKFAAAMGVGAAIAAPIVAGIVAWGERDLIKRKLKKKFPSLKTLDPQ